MLNKNQMWILTLVGSLALVLVIANILMFTHNQKAQAEVNGRGQYLQQTIQLQTLYQEMVKGLADLSVRSNDTQLRDLLTKQGISVSAAPSETVPGKAAKQ